MKEPPSSNTILKEASDNRASPVGVDLNRRKQMRRKEKRQGRSHEKEAQKGACCDVNANKIRKRAELFPLNHH